MNIYFFEIEEGANVGHSYFTSKRRAEQARNKHMSMGEEPSVIFESDAIELIEKLEEQSLLSFKR